jgi:FtsP/CotA-like multicopper oxidase with cupredoxin domain
MSLDRRWLLKFAATLPIAASEPRMPSATENPLADKADHTLRIAPLSLELAPGRTIKTAGYNGRVPGPLLRLLEGRRVRIKVLNDAGYPDLVHWHDLYLPAIEDGAGLITY